MFERAAARGDIDAAAVDALVELYIGFNWVRLLTDRIADDPPGIEAMARTLAGAPPGKAQ